MNKIATTNKNENHALTVYKASAGSGKTFTLSKEYIKHLINNPMSYKSILAVTFTNKATEEMKMRILSKLYGIWKGLPDAKDYVDAIVKETGYSQNFLSERAGWALNNIVNNYSYFRIETIDSFFQSILRNLARELDLTANLRVELNDIQIEQNAVDEMIEELSMDDELLHWIMDYIKENINDEKNWNVIGQIKKFGENIFKEFYKTNSKKLNAVVLQKDFFKEFTSLLYSKRTEAEKAMSAFSQRFFDSLEKHNVTIDDLKNRDKGPAGYFIKLKNKVFDESILTARVKNVIEQQGYEEWVKKTADKSLIAFATDVLTPLLIEAETKRKESWKSYASADLTLRHINQLRLLNSIECKVREMNAEANRFLLSDTHSLLHSLIEDSDTPFIFEKIGTLLETIMIDEFQDTSTIQWKNFKVLLEEIMDHSQGGNLIVGDVKQSIYRWRSGDWRLLNNIDKEFSHRQNQIKKEPLSTNYRSERHIIEFNNEFFQLAEEKESKKLCDKNEYTEQLKNAYIDVKQDIPEKRENIGYVNIQLLAATPSNANDQILEQCEEAVRTLLDAGVRQNEIAILVRSNSTIQTIADYFSEAMPDIKMVSDEAFRLDNSIAVNIIIAAMHFLSHPDDMLTRAFLVKAYQTKVLRNKDMYESKMINAENMASLLPQEFITDSTALLSLPLFELGERLYQIFHLNEVKGEDAYLYAFYDSLNDFIASNTADIDDFVKEWNENIHKKTIQTSDVDGIRLITIHKSKGLEFDHVIIPFCDWKLENANTIWCEPKCQPYNKLPLIPVDYSPKKMMGTIYEDDYHTEHLQNCVDNLNLLYVAFTRASRSLFVIARRGNATIRSYIIEECLPQIKLEGAVFDGDPGNKKDSLKFEYGTISPKTKKEKKQDGNVFLPEISNIAVEYETFANNTEFKQSNKSKEFVESDEDKQDSYIKTGLLLHSLFSRIRTEADIDSSIKQMVMDGIMTEDDVDVMAIKDMLHKRLRTPAVAEWFSGKWQLFNECDILFENPDNGEVKAERPDRVMTDGNKFIVVDFKFGKAKQEHKEQVHHYMTLIKEMGYTDVTGYLWYVYSNEIEEVRL